MRKGKLGKTLRFFAIGGAALLVVAAILALALQFRIRLANDWEQYASLRPAQPPTRASRILVFAPHCDDETLGCGGLLSMAVKNKAKAHVVFITNGDSFLIAVGRAYKTIRVTPAKCIEFACARQAEALRALSVLGLSRSQVTFLGYPDRGLLRLWDTNWDYANRYTSKATGADRSPYRNSLTPGAAYCGQSLIEDIQTVLETEKPTDVYLPHPSDNHPDHYATYCFVVAAIEQLESEDWSPGKKLHIHTYLVHRGDWPMPRGNHPKDRLSPPSALAGSGTNWYSLSLPADVVRKKARAIRAHRSQMALEPGFLMSFARENEISGNMPVRRVVRLPYETIGVDGDPKDWGTVPPCVLDPVNDYVPANLNRGGDVRSIYMCADEKRLYVRVDCVRKLSRRIAYTLSFRGIGRLGVSDHCSLTVRPPDKCDNPVAAVACRGNVLEVSLPRSEFSFSNQIFVQVTTKLTRITIDNTGWQPVQFSRE